MSFKSLQEALREFAQSLQAASIFPAALLVFVNARFICPEIFPNMDWTESGLLIALLALTLMLSYTLYAFNYPLTRLFEGYKFKEWGRFSRLLRAYERALQSLKTDIEEMADELDERKLSPGKSRPASKYGQWSTAQLQAQHSRLEGKLASEYPASEGMVLPTRLGNIIAAFESYSATRYGMDSIALWPRLVPLLKEQSYLDFVIQEKSVFDFLMNTCVMVGVLGLELTYLHVFLNRVGWGLVIFLGALAGVLILHQGMIVAAKQWGLTVRVAFDLYRHELGQRLGLRMSRNDSFKQEYLRWQRVSHFFLYRRQEYCEWFEEFRPQAEVLEQRAQGKAS